MSEEKKEVEVGVSVPENRILTGSDLRNFTEKIDPTFDNKLLVRQDLKLSTSNGFKVSNVLTKQECLYYIEESEKKGYVTIEKEFPKSYRNNLRYLGKCEGLSELLWERLEPIFKVEDLEGMRPYGFDQEGVWIPVGIDTCFTFGKYLPGCRFKPHFDAVFADNPDRRSIYTIQIYLNQEFKGGKTNFYASENPLLLDKHQLEDSVIPETGTALIFNHDTLHEGAEVEEGEKYIMRVDMMFIRIDKSMNEMSEQESKEMKLARETFFRADEMEKDHGNLESAISLYVRAQMLLTSYPSIESIADNLTRLKISPTSPLAKKPLATLFNIPEFQLFNILVLLNVTDLGRLMSTNKYFSKIMKKDSLWKRMYIRDYSIESFSFEEKNNHCAKVNSTREFMVKSLSYKESPNQKKNWLVTYSNIHQFYKKNEITIIDIGSTMVKYGSTSNFRPENGSFIQRVGKRQEYQPHYVMSSMDRITWVVGPDSSAEDRYFAVTNGRFNFNEALREIIQYSLCYTMKRKRPNAPVLLIVNPINYSATDNGQYLSKVRKSINNELVLFRNGGLLALQSHGLTSGVVLMLGSQTTVLASFVNGEQVSAISLDVTGENITGEIKELSDGYATTSECKKVLYDQKNTSSYYRPQPTLKDHWFLLTRVSQDYQKDLNKTLFKDQFSFQVPEIYFNPSVSVRKQTKSCKDIVSSSIQFLNDMKSHSKFKNNQDDLSKIIITGGFSAIPGFIERFEKEISLVVETKKMDHINIIASSDRYYDQIKGAKIDLSLTESFHDKYQKI